MTVSNDVPIGSSLHKGLSRRTFVAGTAAGLAATALVGARTAMAAEPATDETLGKTVCFWVASSRCVNCGACANACEKYHPEAAHPRRKVVTYTKPNGKEVYISRACMHCDDPSCARVCPAHAITKNESGVVSVDPSKCIGCKYCYEACPFSVPQYGPNGMDKCDYCASIGVKPGTTPRCAQACPTGALNACWAKDVEERSNDKAKRVESSTNPSMWIS